ncbi:MAG TPA: hypothetical protein VFK37_05745 [Bacillales bacterium]|nr:hypothetical protein [Bacillales bacterium]
MNKKEIKEDDQEADSTWCKYKGGHNGDFGWMKEIGGGTRSYLSKS